MKTKIRSVFCISLAFFAMVFGLTQVIEGKFLTDLDDNSSLHNVRRDVSVAGTNDAIMDFNGDGKTDWAVRRPETLTSGAPTNWYVRYNGEENFVGLKWGVTTNIDISQPFDFDGDGKDDVAVFRNNYANQQGFYILYSSDGTFHYLNFGRIGDTPVSGDYDGDGTDDPAVFTTSSGVTGGPLYWCYIGSDNNPNREQTCIQWGVKYNDGVFERDVAYPGDFDGDGKADFAIRRPFGTTNPNADTPTFFAVRTSSGQEFYELWGVHGDRIVPGDYNGDGKTDLCVARGYDTSSTLPVQWFIHYTGGTQPNDYINYGTSASQIVQGDYDGDGADDIALWVLDGVELSSPGYFWVRPSSNPNQSIIYKWGSGGDSAVLSFNNRTW